MKISFNFILSSIDKGLNRENGIKASVNVEPTSNSASLPQNQVIIFQLMDDNTPISIVSVQGNITKKQAYSAYFNVSNPEKTSYYVKVFVMDSFNSDLSLPVNLAEPIKLTGQIVTAYNQTHGWNFNGDYSDKVGKLNANIVGSPKFIDIDKKEGDKSIYFDGVNDELNMGDVKLGSDFTLSFWVRPSDIHSNWTPMVSKFGAQKTFWVGQHDYDGKLRFGIYLDGNNETSIDTEPGAIVDNTWTHVAITYDGHYQCIYIDGKLSKKSDKDINTKLSDFSGDFKVANKAVGKYKGFMDDIRTYDSALNDKQAMQLFNTVQKESQDISLLINQVGYRPSDTKLAMLRSTVKNPIWNPEGAIYKIKKTSDNSIVKTGDVIYSSEKWNSFWWGADFTNLSDDGEYYLEVEGRNLPKIVSNKFKISKDLLMSEGLIQSQLTNLNERIVDIGKMNIIQSKTPDSGILQVKTIGLGAPTFALNDKINIFRDCGGSNMSEIESVTITINALIDALKYQDKMLSDADRADIKSKLILSANYLVACQEKTDNKETNGRFHHMGMGWSEEEIQTMIFRDMPEAIVALSRASEVLKNSLKIVDAKTNKTEGQYANEWLEAAKLAYNCMTFRPYYLNSELTSPNKYNIQGWKDAVMNDLRTFYNLPNTWTLPLNNSKTDLRTKDIFPLIWACTQLYNVDTENKDRESYLDKADEFTDIVSKRQYVDYNSPIDGTYGYFYEFSDNSKAFVTEMNQWSKWCMGNYDPLRMTGVIELLKNRPNTQNSAKYYNMLKLYGENYLLKQPKLSPFGYAPLTMYKDLGISFYRVLNHGANSIYGLTAVNMLEMGNFLNDSRYQDIAGRNVNYITGSNPGYPNKREATKWGAFSFAYGVGEASYGGTAHIPPKGSISNGFTSSAQFQLNPLNTSQDGPNGIYASDNEMYFEEDGVMHSLSFLNGVVRLEASSVLNISTMDGDKKVPAKLSILLDGKTYDYNISDSGKIQISDLPVGKNGVMKVSYNGSTITKEVNTIASGNLTWNANFKDNINVEIKAPSVLEKNSSNKCIVTITNNGTEVKTARINLTGSSVNVVNGNIETTIAAGAVIEKEFTITAGLDSVPYLLYAYTTTSYSENISTVGGNIK